MAAAARDASNSVGHAIEVKHEIELKHEEQAVRRISMNTGTEIRLTELGVENEGKQWLLANQRLLLPELPVSEKGSDVVSDQHEEDERNEITPGMRGGYRRACEEVRCLPSPLIGVLELT